jgi:hypothetical protein
MDGWMDGWMGGWVGGWVDGYTPYVSVKGINLPYEKTTVNTA